MGYSPQGCKDSDVTKVTCICMHASSHMGFPGGSLGENPPANAGDVGLTPGLENPLENEMTTHSSILAWEIPWTEEAGRL